jgi:hypothetical protein
VNCRTGSRPPEQQSGRSQRTPHSVCGVFLVGSSQAACFSLTSLRRLYTFRQGREDLVEKVIKRQGPFTLVETEQGFAWTMTSASGARWYWHPGEKQWTSCKYAGISAEEATAGLDPDNPQACKEFHHHES